jgi:hypothetical protein
VNLSLLPVGLLAIETRFRDPSRIAGRAHHEMSRVLLTARRLVRRLSSYTTSQNRTRTSPARTLRNVRGMALRIVMRTFCTVVVLGALTAWPLPAIGDDVQDGVPLPGRAIPLVQEARQPPELSVHDSAARERELDEWIRNFSEWKKWADEWHNRREPGWFSNFRQRRQQPDPPPWLVDACKITVEDNGKMAEACTLLAEWSAASAPVTNAPAAASSATEDNNKTIWWEHVHLDLAWPALQSGVTYFGVVGMHVTTKVRGRFEIFVAPGAMLLNVPTRDGKRAWKLATNYGIAYRLAEFSLPGDRRALLHVNLAKAWLFAAGPEVPTKSTDFIGFSATFKKKP